MLYSDQFFSQSLKNQIFYIFKIEINFFFITKITHFYIAMSIDEQIFRLKKNLNKLKEIFIYFKITIDNS
jgi:hypothetical protein